MVDNIKELKKRKWFLALVIVVLLLVPTIYCVVFLRAYWDPYGRLDQVPVALVNEDEGKDGENNGKKLVDELVSQNVLDLRIEDRNTAEKDLEVGKVYATITIPKDFTVNLLSAEGNKKTQAEIAFMPNQKSNYVVSQILKMATKEVEQSVNSKASEKIVWTLTDKLKGIPGQVRQIDDGLVQLSGGSSKLRNAYGEFDGGVKQLSVGTKQLNAGIEELQIGTHTLKTGVAKLEDLSSGVLLLQNGVKKYTEGVNEYTNVASKLVDGMQLVADLLVLPFGENANFGLVQRAACGESGERLETELCQKTENIINMLAENIAQPYEKVLTMTPKNVSDIFKKMLNEGGAELNDGVTELASGVSKMPALVAGVDELSNGVDMLAVGSKQLTDGAQVLADSSSQVADGIVQLDDGLKTAENKVSESIDKSEAEMSKLDGLAEFAAEPATVNEEPVNEVGAYGVAFAPFFISLSLWVGSFVLFVVLYSDRDRRFKNCDMDTKKRVKRTLLYMGAAVAQGVALGIILRFALGLEITNEALYMGSLILVSVMFEAIIEFLIVCLGDLGKFIALILLIIQIAASGGTFPIETVSGGFKWMYNFLPMHYTINLFKEATVKITSDVLIPSIVVVGVVTVVFVGINLVAGIIYDRKQKK